MRKLAILFLFFAGTVYADAKSDAMKVGDKLLNCAAFNYVKHSCMNPNDSDYIGTQKDAEMYQQMGTMTLKSIQASDVAIDYKLKHATYTVMNKIGDDCLKLKPLINKMYAECKLVMDQPADYLKSIR